MHELINYFKSSLKFEVVINGGGDDARDEKVIYEKAALAAFDVFSKIDRNNDGKISLDEFALWLNGDDPSIINELNATHLTYANNISASVNDS